MTQRLLLASLFILINASLIGCASTYKAPTTRMLSSESEGLSHKSLQLGLHSPYEAVITTYIPSVPIATSTHDVHSAGTLGLSGNYGILERLDVGANLDIGVSPIYYVKFQALGNSKANATLDEVSLSIFGGFGFESGETESFGSNTSNPSSVIRSSSLTEQLGTVIGYRLSKSVLPLIGASVGFQHLEGTQQLSDTPNLATPFEDHPRFTEIHLGAEFRLNDNPDAQFFLQPELQRGWLDTFGSRTYLTTFIADVGIQF